jgi:AcrR family transcriptional regulator
MERRQAAADQTRARILQAARKLLLAEDFREFSMEAVAQAAGVSRLTVYYQFDSRAGLLEALYNHLAKSGHLGRLPDVFRYGNDGLQKLHEFIEVFVDFWASDRDVIRRLHALGAIDAEIGQGLRARNERRRNGLRVILELYQRYHPFVATEEPIMLDSMHILTSFETFDALAVPGRTAEETRTIITRIADLTIGALPRRTFQADPRFDLRPKGRRK